MQLLGQEVRAYLDERFAGLSGQVDAGQFEEQINAVVDWKGAVDRLVQVMAAPKELVMDREGKPVGVKPVLPDFTQRIDQLKCSHKEE